MIKNVILCETINGGIRGLLTTDDLSKVNFDKVVGFTRENQECRDDNGMPMREQYAIGVPYVCNLEELERVYKDFINRPYKPDDEYYHYRNRYSIGNPNDEMVEMIQTFGVRTTPENANCYISYLTNLPFVLKDNMYVVETKEDLENIIKTFLRENEKEIVRVRRK